MGREIKFRAWTFDDEFMVDDAYDGDDFVFTVDGGVVKLLGANYDQINQVVGMYGECKHSIMQYTGLKDKNGTEIYEGDILCFDWKMQESNKLVADDCENIKGVVSFCSAKFIVRYFNSAMLFDLSEINQLTHERFWRSCNDYYKMTDFKVIGNIYENPELLEGGE